MRIGNIVIRKPWTRYVEVPLEQQVYLEIKRSILEDLLKDTDEQLKDLQ